MPAPIKYILEDITTLSHFELSNYDITGPKEGKNKGPELEPCSTPPLAPTILFKEPGMLLLYFENAIVAMFHLTGLICKQLCNLHGEICSELWAIDVSTDNSGRLEMVQILCQ